MSSKQQEMKGLGEGGWEAERVHVEKPRLSVLFNTEEAVVDKKRYPYGDVVGYRPDGSCVILYEATKTAIYDERLLEAIDNHHPFKVYSRKKITDSFKYVGLSTEVSVHTRRTDDQHLVIRLVIRNVVNEDVPQQVDGYCKYKVDALVHAGVMDRQRNWRITMHIKDPVKGFFVSV